MGSQKLCLHRGSPVPSQSVLSRCWTKDLSGKFVWRNWLEITTTLYMDMCGMSVVSLARMDESRLNRKIFVWSVGKKNWIVNVRSNFPNIYMEHILDIDSDRDLKANIIMTELDLALTQHYEQQ